ncbi:MAG: CAP domain-containing protein [Planctomycetota bacterium]
MRRTTRPRRSATVMLALLLLVPVAARAAAYNAPSPEPTPAEVEILLLMNRFRADPHGEADRVLALRDEMWHPEVDWEMFKREMLELQPGPPLVFDLAALDAARKHSWYMIHNGLGHGEIADKEGYTGASFSDRMKAAGFTGSPRAENCYRDARDPAHSSWGFIVDFGKGGEGGMQPGRGHRMNMISSKSNVVGPAAVEHGEHISVTHNFGKRNGRFAGGVVYLDRNRNGAYDAGEGKADVRIATADGSASCRTWSSGAYTLELPGTGPVTLVAELGESRFQQQYPAGEDNVLFDWSVPQAADLARADALLDAVPEAGDSRRDQQRRFAALVDLAVAAEGLCLDPERQQRVTGLVAEVEPAISTAQDQVDELIAAGDLDALDDALDEHIKTFRRTALAPWFEEAEAFARAKTMVDNALSNRAKINRSQADRLIKGLEAARDQARSAFRTRFGALLARASGLRNGARR